MLTKFKLYIGEDEYELSEDDLRNWGDIKCSYKREDFGGVVRSFTSQFEFVNHAMDLLREAYLDTGFNTRASISVLVADDNWNYEERFSCPLDFSSVTWGSNSLKINSVDSSLAAVIKAKKSAKYEFEVGTDIKPDDTLHFDRITMQESASYEFTQGTQYDDCADIRVMFKRDELPYVGNVGSEIAVNGMLFFSEDQCEDTPYVLKAVKDVKVKFDCSIGWRRDEGAGYGVKLFVKIRRNGSFIDVSTYEMATITNATRIGDYTNSSQLPEPNNSINNSNSFATVNGIVWIMHYGPSGYAWESTGKKPAEYFNDTVAYYKELELKAGDLVVISSQLQNPTDSQTIIRFTKSDLKFSWESIGEEVEIQVFKPRRIADALLKKIGGDSFAVNSHFSNYDARVASTYLMAAESARGLEDAKFYSSFSEFCDWMATVFGYVYYIGSPLPPKYTKNKDVGEYVGDPWQYENGRYNGPVYSSNICYIPQHSRFFYHHHTDSGDTLYTQWTGCDDYNDPATGRPRTDTLFRILTLSAFNYYYFEEYTGQTLYPKLYDHQDDYIGDDGKTLYFVHRSELFSNAADLRSMKGCKDFQYSVDSANIYSTITAGYEKKDYEGINGRDEFNFANTYTTGCTVSDKPLSLMSKYRADCYGIEFAVQKRGNKTTDDKSDQDVFFVLCRRVWNNLVVDRTLLIQNAINIMVFNGAFSPMNCIKANAGIIGLQSQEMTLEFASSTGNSSVIIGDEPMNSNITLNNPIATCGILEFTSGDVDEIADTDEIIEVSDNGTTYRGYLKEVDIKYARSEAAKYKLIVKEMEI